MHTKATDVRDGIIFLTGLILLIVVIISLTRLTQDQGMYAFKIRFARAQNLPGGAVVQVSGVPVGRVDTVSLQPDSNQSVVTAKVYDSVKIYADDLFAISAGGLVGEKYLAITPAHTNGARVTPGMEVTGVTTPEIDDLIGATSKLLAKLNATADGVQALVGDSALRQHAQHTLANLERTSAASADIAGTLNAQLKSSRGDLTAAITDLRNTTHSSAEFADSVNRLLARHQADLDDTVAGIRQTSTASADLVANANRLIDRNGAALDGILADLNAVSRDIRQVSAALAPKVAGSKMVENLETASAHVAALTQRLDSAATAADGLLNDKDLAATLHASAQHLRVAGENLEAMTVKAREAAGAAPLITADLQSATANMKDAAATIKEALGSVKETMGNVQAITGNVRRASDDLPLMTHPFGAIAPESADNVLHITRSLRQTSTDVSGMTHKLSGVGDALARTRVTPDARYLWLSPGAQSTRADVNLNVRNPFGLLRVGVADINHGTTVNAQLGKSVTPNLTVRGGLLQSSPGVGVDAALGRAFGVSGELFVPRTLHGNLLADYALPGLGGAWRLTAGWYDLFTPRRAAGAGIAYRP